MVFSSMHSFAISVAVDSLMYGFFALISATTLYRLRSNNLSARHYWVIRITTSSILLSMSIGLLLELVAFFLEISNVLAMEIVIVVLEGISLFASYMVMIWGSRITFPNHFNFKSLLASACMSSVLPVTFWSGLSNLILWVGSCFIAKVLTDS
ncbi:hypothetical protein K435DRAFT_171078 [Dendrothele bispora CBS 962.96]|uniref:Uncharacterized protein n=1 Tax=Dendrothele bispora (strain CBS 962.96) TaxID=1314807 RepID=A0A4S8MWW3_DENBC|nr:hypothetical protein K435DRAFT_171078 [Dendrothele bispora CBS 962.96]